MNIQIDVYGWRHDVASNESKKIRNVTHGRIPEKREVPSETVILTGTDTFKT